MLLWLGNEKHRSRWCSDVPGGEVTTVAEIVSSCVVYYFIQKCLVASMRFRKECNVICDRIRLVDCERCGVNLYMTKKLKGYKEQMI